MLTVGEVIGILDGLNLPNTQMYWYPMSAPPMPYVVMVPHETTNRFTDNSVMVKWVKYDLELYTRERNVPLEQSIEAAFDTAHVGWERDHFADPDGPAVCAVYSVTLEEQEASDG